MSVRFVFSFARAFVFVEGGRVAAERGRARSAATASARRPTRGAGTEHTRSVTNFLLEPPRGAARVLCARGNQAGRLT